MRRFGVPAPISGYLANLPWRGIIARYDSEACAGQTARDAAAVSGGGAAGAAAGG